VTRRRRGRQRAPRRARRRTLRSAHFLNDYGERIDILVLDAQGCRRCESWTIEGDSTQVLCASQRARTLVLTGPDGMEISRSPIHLAPEFLTEIDL
jgi:hypothetical protein